LGMALDELKDNEKAIQVNDIDVLIDEDIKPYVEGYVIDFVNTPYGDHFTLRSEQSNSCC
jgi:Fe-S cluster assembly iron-binding protein IscA